MIRAFITLYAFSKHIKVLLFLAGSLFVAFLIHIFRDANKKDKG